MKEHYEVIRCPYCNAIEVAVVKHRFPVWDYTHLCSKCSQWIMESEWENLGTLFNDNCENIFRQMKSNLSGVVIITDPPYGVRKTEEWDDVKYFQDNIRDWLAECLRIAEHTMIWFCANRMFPLIFKSIKPEQFLREHHWNKPKGSQFNGASNNQIWYSAEPILVFTKDREKTVKNFNPDAKWNYDDLQYGTIAKKTWNHPTAKPVPLMAELIMHYTLSTDTVFDPFGGSGTTAEAAIKTGRKFIYIEQDPEHFNTALERIKNIHGQYDAFGYAKPKIEELSEQKLFED